VYGIAVGDMNRDGEQEIAVVADQTLTLYKATDMTTICSVNTHNALGDESVHILPLPAHSSLPGTIMVAAKFGNVLELISGVEQNMPQVTTLLCSGQPVYQELIAPDQVAVLCSGESALKVFAGTKLLQQLVVPTGGAPSSFVVLDYSDALYATADNGSTTISIISSNAKQVVDRYLTTAKLTRGFAVARKPLELGVQGNYVIQLDDTGQLQAWRCAVGSQSSTEYFWSGNGSRDVYVNQIIVEHILIWYNWKVTVQNIRVQSTETANFFILSPALPFQLQANPASVIVGYQNKGATSEETISAVVTVESDDTVLPMWSVNWKIRKLSASLDLQTPIKIDFGTVQVLETAMRTLTLNQEHGRHPVTLIACHFLPAPQASESQFSIQDPIILPVTLDPQHSLNVIITFMPSAPGQMTGLFVLSWMDIHQQSYQNIITLSGTGL
jgi:hypothetical protein